MSSTAITTVVQMLESLPDSVQGQVIDHLREYLLDLQDELEWDAQFNRTQPQLVAAAQRAKEEIAASHVPAALVSGMLRPSAELPSDHDLKQDYISYLDDKYR